MTALKWITNEAKKLKKKDRNRKTWKEYISQASAVYAKKHKGKSPVGHKHKKRIAATKFIEKGESKRTPAKKTVRINRTKNGRFKGTTKVAGIKTTSKSHTDKNKITANIQVGRINGDNIARLRSLVASLDGYEKVKKGLIDGKKNFSKSYYNATMKRIKDNIASLKKQITEVKKNIK